MVVRAGIPLARTQEELTPVQRAFVVECMKMEMGHGTEHR